MGVIVSIGGMIFGYDTGQISGFLEMPNFLENFGDRGPDGQFAFSNWKSGLIVSLVRGLSRTCFTQILNHDACSFQLARCSGLSSLRPLPISSVEGIALSSGISFSASA
jgi:hypothetical protein